MLKRLSILLLAALMAATAFSGYGIGEASQEITFPLEEPVTFTGMTILWKNTYPLSENITWKKIEEDTNVWFDLTYEFLREEAGQKGKLIMAGGEYPEVIWKSGFLGNDTIVKYGADGVLIPLEDLIREYMPTLTKLLDEKHGWTECAASDGHIYSLPGFSPSEELGVGNGVFWINQKWMDDLGLTMPTNYEELYTVLKAFKEDDPNGNGLQDEIPIISCGGFGGIRNLLGTVGTQYGVQRQADYMIYTDNGLEFYPVQDCFKEFLEWMKVFYEEGLIDPNAFTQTDDQRRSVASSGDIIGMIHGTNAEGVGIHPDAYGNYTPLLPFNPDNYARSSGIDLGGMSVTDKCKNPEVLMAWADWFYTAEGSITVREGIKDVHWYWNEDGTFSEAADAPGGDERAGYYLTGAAPNIINYDHRYKLIALPENIEISKIGTLREAEKYRDGGIYSYGSILPKLVFTDEEEKDRIVLVTDIIAYVDNYCAEVITGVTDLDTTWEDFKKACEERGYKDLEAIYQAADERTR